MPVVLGGIEASLRRIAHFDYWQDRYGARSCSTRAPTSCCMATRNGRSSKLRIARARRANRDMTDIRGTALMRDDTPDGWWEIDSTRIDRPGRIDQIVNPYVNTQDAKRSCDASSEQLLMTRTSCDLFPMRGAIATRTVIRLPSFEKVRNDAVLYAHCQPRLHLETNPGNARALVQAHEERISG